MGLLARVAGHCAEYAAVCAAIVDTGSTHRGSAADMKAQILGRPGQTQPVAAELVDLVITIVLGDLVYEIAIHNHSLFALYRAAGTVTSTSLRSCDRVG